MKKTRKQKQSKISRRTLIGTAAIRAQSGWTVKDERKARAADRKAFGSRNQRRQIAKAKRTFGVGGGDVTAETRDSRTGRQTILVGRYATGKMTATPATRIARKIHWALTGPAMGVCRVIDPKTMKVIAEIDPITRERRSIVPADEEERRT